MTGDDWGPEQMLYTCFGAQLFQASSRGCPTFGLLEKVSGRRVAEIAEIANVEVNLHG